MESLGDSPPGPLSAPVSLTARHDTRGFDCGEDSLNDWLRKRALPNQQSGASRTFVAVDDRDRVGGYYALATGAIARDAAVSAVARRMPPDIPILLVGRLAVDRSRQGQGYGAALLQDALLRCLQVADHVGVRAVLVHALDERAANFYRQHGFRPSPIAPLTMMVRIADLKANL